MIVRDGAGNPVAGVHVVVVGAAAERDADTGSQGYVALQALPLGTYALRVERGGYDPIERSVTVSGAVTEGSKVVALRLEPLSFSAVRAPVGSSLVTQPIVTADPNVAHQLGTVAGVTLLPSAVPGAGGISLDGTAPQDARFELDGIPLAGGGTQAALRARNALALESIQIAPGAATDGISLRGAIGGTINYVTPAIGSAQNLTLGAGYASGFGNYQVLQFTQTSGQLGYAFNAITGSGDNRAQTLKAAYQASPATVVNLAVYGSQTSADPSASLPAIDAPAYALGVSSSVDAGTLRLRTYGSSLGDDRIRGSQIGYDVPVGSELFSLGYDRSTESSPEGVASIAQTTSSFLVRAETPLTKSLRFSAADVFSSGNGFAARSDPQAGLAYRPSEWLTLRASAGSSYATQPLVALDPARPSLANAPATAFAYHLSAGAQLSSLDTLSLDAFRINQFDRFASLSNARSSGLTVGFSHAVSGTGLAVSGYASALHSYAFGTVQPASRYASTGDVVLGGAQFAGMPYSSGRLELAYQRADGIAVRVGTSYYGANNGLGPKATTLSDAGLLVPVGKLFNAQFGVRNLFGAVPPPSATSLYGGPGELTLSLGRSLGRP